MSHMLPQRPQPAQTQRPTVTVDAQPRNMMEMNPTNAPPRARQCSHEQNGANRVRGGGAAKDCCIGAIGVFLCFESCEACCNCVADIICCPCEMLC